MTNSTDTALDGQIALVTGAGRGIGRAIAEILARNGATVVLTARTASEVQDVAAHIAMAGGRALAWPGDVTQLTFVEELFGRVQSELGGLDILVNNAGNAPFAPVEELPVRALRDCLELNVIAVFACMQQAVRLMQKQGTGKIINIGSVRSHWSEAGDSGAYNASKAALRALTETVARQLHGTDNSIAVGLVCPGIVDTTLTNAAGPARADWLRPETVAGAVLHAVCAPPGVNVFDTVLFPTTQSPW